ncbi:hypothetical protein ADIARSV_1836 [Arcticibacter svalbardensis MN12-7]|uniref:Uncharacterized protein n=1 Tax=Arcticibacter svalbardensis MN12-7 TaxID=1150600 RepID=R9GTU0_9SPHI|nr:hypothetical protein ADIARSV_1836 [Arcticibacter svalbardensis MN12-7]
MHIENIKNSIMMASLYSNLRTEWVETNLLHHNLGFKERFTSMELNRFYAGVKSNSSLVLL